jgi:broad specificity phosphatase PhoE
MGAIPGGDNVLEFKKKCAETFFAITKRKDFIAARNVVFVVHGGNIMALMEKLQGGDFFDYYLPPCGVVSCEF